MGELFPTGINVHRKVLRLTFDYEGDRVQLVSSQPVDMTLVGWDPFDGAAEGNGFWAELADPGGDVLYRRVLQDPTHGAEAFSADGEITRSSAARRKGTFVVLVPALVQDVDLILRGSFEAEGKYRASREIGRFRLPVAGRSPEES